MASKLTNKVEILRALERTKRQFDTLIQSNCRGANRGPILGQVFSEKD